MVLFQWRISNLLGGFCRRTPIKIFREADLGAHEFSLDSLISFGPEASDLHFASFRIAFWCSLLEPDGDLIRELCQVPRSADILIHFVFVLSQFFETD